jgi:hypothetical protein
VLDEKWEELGERNQVADEFAILKLSATSHLSLSTARQRAPRVLKLVLVLEEPTQVPDPGRMTHLP